MITRIQKWGNSLAVRIPKALAIEVGFEKDLPVEITLDKDRLILTPLQEPPLLLEHLLAQINEQNLHHEIDTGSATGNETW